MVIMRVVKTLMLALVMLPWFARAELVVEVTQGVSEPTPVAVVPFSWSGTAALPEDVAKIIDEDLSRSGLFSTLDRSTMLSLPSTRDQVFFRDWRMTQSDYLVIGRIAPVNADRVSITAHRCRVVGAR